ncbi:MAG: hypothetical protein V1664_04380 [Candidatus Uhrbacteria bacterium]
MGAIVISAVFILLGVVSLALAAIRISPHLGRFPDGFGEPLILAVIASILIGNALVVLETRIAINTSLLVTAGTPLIIIISIAIGLFLGRVRNRRNEKK